MLEKTILNISDSNYKKFLELVAKELSIRNKSDYHLELKQLLALNRMEIDICVLSNKTSRHFETWQYDDKERKARNKEVDDYFDFILDYNNFINGTDEDKHFIIEEWIDILNASRLTYSQTIMKKIKQLRLEQKKTQQDIANYLGISYQAYAHYEKGRRIPDIDTLIKLSRYFRVSIDYLLDKGDEQVLNYMATKVERVPYAKVRFSNYTSHFIKKLLNQNISDIQLYSLTEDDVKVIANMIKQLTKQN